MIHDIRPRGRDILLLLLTLGLLGACAPTGDTTAAEGTAGAQAPGSITAHMNGRADFFMGVGGSN